MRPWGGVGRAYSVNHAVRDVLSRVIDLDDLCRNREHAAAGGDDAVENNLEARGVVLESEPDSPDSHNLAVNFQSGGKHRLQVTFR